MTGPIEFSEPQNLDQPELSRTKNNGRAVCTLKLHEKYNYYSFIKADLALCNPAGKRNDIHDLYSRPGPGIRSPLIAISQQ